MSSNTCPPKTPLAGPANQLHEKVQKEAAKGTTQKRRERRNNRKAEVAEAPTDITPSSSQPPPTPTTVDPTVSREKNLPISERAKGDEAPTGITPFTSQPPALVPPASHVPASTPLIPPPISTTIVYPPASHGNDQPISEKTKGAEAQTGITSSPSQPTALVPPAGHLPASNPLVPSPTSTPLIPPPIPTTIVDPSASHGNDLPISGSAPALPQSFAFGPITTAFGQSPPVSLPLPPVIEPKTLDFGTATTTFTQASLRPSPHKTFTEVEVSLQLTTAKAETRARADHEISQLTTKLEESKIESSASKKELEATKTGLEKSKTELARAKKELKLTQETLETQQGATKARIDGTATSFECIKAELNFERTARQGFEAELAARREVLVVFKNNKLSNGRALALLLLLLALIFPLWPMFLFWYIWNRMQLPLAVVSQIDSVICIRKRAKPG